MEVTPAKEVERETAGEIEKLGIQGQGKREWEEKKLEMDTNICEIFINTEQYTVEK